MKERKQSNPARPASASKPASGSVDKHTHTHHSDNSHETADEINDAGAGLADAPDAGLAADAAAFIGRGAAADARFRGGPAEIKRQAGRLTRWAEVRKLILSDSFFEGLEKHPGTTAEHEVFHRPSDNRALKRTYPGTFGVTPDTKGNQTAATPLFYLRRLQLMNEAFAADMRLEGVVFGQSLLVGQSGPQPSVVISQPWIRAADPAYPHPTESEVARFLRDLDFEPLPGAYFGWYRQADLVTVMDARPDNFIMSAEGVVPIDLVIANT